MTRPDFGTGKPADYEFNAKGLPIVVTTTRWPHPTAFHWSCNLCGAGCYVEQHEPISWSAAMEAAHAHQCDGIRLRWLVRRLDGMRAFYSLPWRYDGRTVSGELAGILAEIGDGQ